MTKSIFILVLLLSTALLAKAVTVTGKVTDQHGEGIPGVNVFLQGTYDGATTYADGRFTFETTASGEQTLIVRFVGYKEYVLSLDLSDLPVIDIQLKEEINKLSGVTITAGSFEASDEKKTVVLKPLDIAMTAGATADIAGALNTLPGTTTNAETGRLFVRGGTSEETQAFIDGVLVHNFYTAAPNNVPSRSRFSPFLFKGTFFSTGGYSAEFGQALSSILSLSSNDLPDKTRTDLSLMTVGTDIAHTQKWENGSIYGQFQYVNLDPYNQLIDQQYDWEDGYTSENVTFMLRQKLSKDDMLKVYANYDHSAFVVTMPNINRPEGNRTDLNNSNFYVNVNYRRAIGDNSTGYLGVSYGRTLQDVNYNNIVVQDLQNSSHAKGYLTTDIAQVSLKIGGEVLATANESDVTLEDGNNPITQFDSEIAVGFLEAEYYITNSLTLRAGMRYAYYSLFEQKALSPRLSMALKTSEHSQLSAAYGQFHQLPTKDILLISNQVQAEQADHYMLSFQRINDHRTFRAEVYYKKYDELVKFDAIAPFDPTGYNNTGGGYAKGIDLFWRDSKTIKNVDYWLSYSYIDTERDYRNFPYQTTPNFASKHNFALVYKQFIPSIKTQLGATFSYNAGRPYNNPNQEQFNASTTPDYTDLSFNFAYLHRQNIILYASVTNLLGVTNVFNYDFKNAPDDNGFFASMPITQPAKRFFFIGLFITLTKGNQANNLENL